jgi:hypothetical protein
MLKIMNKVVSLVTKLQHFFFFIQAFQKGLTAFAEEWANLTGQKVEDILKESQTETKQLN